MKMTKGFLVASMLFIHSLGFAGNLQKDIEKAAEIIQDFSRIPEDSIPREVLYHCKGLAIITVIKAGFVFSARGGVGIVIAKTPNG